MKKSQKKINDFSKEKDWDQFHFSENLAKSISVETGELLECFQRTSEYNLEEAKEKIADVLKYCIQMADKLGFYSKQIALNKMKKTAKKYPVENARNKSLMSLN